MNRYGIEVSPRHMPELDPDFIPCLLYTSDAADE